MDENEDVNMKFRIKRFILLMAFLLSCDSLGEEHTSGLKPNTFSIFDNKENNEYLKRYHTFEVSKNNRKYMIVQSNDYTFSDYSVVSLLRQNSDGNIYEYLDEASIYFHTDLLPDSLRSQFQINDSEQLRYAFDRETGDYYLTLIQMPFIVNMKRDHVIAMVEIGSKNDIVEIGGSKIAHCTRFDYKFFSVDHIAYSEWFSPELGLVKIQFKSTQTQFFLNSLDQSIN
jgi:hypothetical protein